jgi:hypothetical protein
MTSATQPQGLALWKTKTSRREKETDYLDPDSFLSTLTTAGLRIFDAGALTQDLGRKCTPPDGDLHGHACGRWHRQCGHAAGHSAWPSRAANGKATASNCAELLGHHGVYCRVQQSSQAMAQIATAFCTKGAPQLRPSGRAQSQSQRLDATAAAISGTRLCLARWRS